MNQTTMNQTPRNQTPMPLMDETTIDLLKTCKECAMVLPIDNFKKLYINLNNQRVYRDSCCQNCAYARYRQYRYGSEANNIRPRGRPSGDLSDEQLEALYQKKLRGAKMRDLQRESGLCYPSFLKYFKAYVASKPVSQ